MINIHYYILFRDRPKFLRDLLASIATQDLPIANITVSDNSVKDYNLIDLDLTSFNYIKRQNLSFEQHFNLIITECTSDYIVILHDDDILGPSFNSDAVNFIEDNGNKFSCFSYNASIFTSSDYYKDDYLSLHKQLFFRSKNLLTICDSIGTLLYNYFNLGRSGAPPFPSYIYNIKYLKEVRIDFSTAGKYSDVTFLCSLVKNMPIMWINKVNFYYRVHSTNDSNDYSFIDALRLSNYIKINIHSFSDFLTYLDFILLKNSQRSIYVMPLYFIYVIFSLMRPSLYRYIFSIITR